MDGHDSCRRRRRGVWRAASDVATASRRRVWRAADVATASRRRGATLVRDDAPRAIAL